MITKPNITIIAVFCIFITAAIAGICVYMLTNSGSIKANPNPKTLPSQITQSPTQPTIIPISSSTKIPTPTFSTATNPTSTVAGSDVELQQAMRVLSDFNEYLNIAEYNKASALFGWSSINNPSEVFGSNYVQGDGNKTLANVCKNPNYCLKFYKILKAEKRPNDLYVFTVQFQTKDNKIFVNSSQVAGQFLSYTDFMYEVKKTGEGFKVITAPNMFVIE